MKVRARKKRQSIYKVIHNMGAELCNREGALQSPRVDLQTHAFVKKIDGPIIVDAKTLIKVKPYWRKSKNRWRAGWVDFALLTKAFEN